MRDEGYYAIAALIFLGAAVLHALRVFNGWDLVYGELEVPNSISIAIAVVTGYLSLRGFRAVREVMPN